MNARRGADRDRRGARPTQNGSMRKNQAMADAFKFERAKASGYQLIGAEKVREPRHPTARF